LSITKKESIKRLPTSDNTHAHTQRKDFSIKKD